MRVEKGWSQMATKAAKQDVKEEKEKRQPDFVVRCRQSPDSDFWQTIGAAWSANINGETGYSVRLHAIPTNWDGSFLLLPPKESE
jgi:hypothetical protein